MSTACDANVPGICVLYEDGDTYSTTDTTIEVWLNSSAEVRHPGQSDKVVSEITIKSTAGSGVIKFKDENPKGYINAVALPIAEKAATASWYVNYAGSYIKFLVPLDKGDVEWDYNPVAGATASLKLKVRVKNLAG